MWRPTAALLVLLLASALEPSAADTSRLWGRKGEKWSARGRLVDFSYAGYGGGQALPLLGNGESGGELKRFV